jgi:hypothetical protein
MVPTPVIIWMPAKMTAMKTSPVNPVPALL